MEINKYYSEEELSGIRFSCADEAIGEVKNLFVQDQLDEERILLEIYSPNGDELTTVDFNRLKIDRIFSRKQIIKKNPFSRYKFVDSNRYQARYEVATILAIKNEQRRLGTEFKGIYALIKKTRFGKIENEPILFAAIGEDIYYLLNELVETSYPSKRPRLNSIFQWIKNKIFIKTSSK